MRVKAIMAPAPKTCTPDTTLAEAANLMWAGDCGVLPVVDTKAHWLLIVSLNDIALAAGVDSERVVDALQAICARHRHRPDDAAA